MPAVRHYYLGVKVLPHPVFKLRISLPWLVVPLLIKFSEDDTSMLNSLENGWAWLEHCGFGEMECCRSPTQIILGYLKPFNILH